MIITNDLRWDGFGAQFQSIIWSILWAECQGHRFYYSEVERMSNDTGDEKKFIQDANICMNLSTKYQPVSAIIHGEPIFALKWPYFYKEIERDMERFHDSPSFERLRQYYFENKTTPFDTNHYNVAVHIRRPASFDNRVEGANTPLSYYIHTMKYIVEHYKGSKPLLFHIYSQGSQSQFYGLTNLPIQFHLEDDTFTSFKGMTFADALITSASSMSYTAALLSKGDIYYLPFWHPPRKHWHVMSKLQETFLEVNDIHILRNVKSIICQETNKFGWTRENGYQVIHEEPYGNPETFYFIMDTHNENAFAHWVFENFVYLFLYFHVKQQIPVCKLVVKDKKDYKYLFLCSHGVDKNDIVEAKDLDIQYQTLHKEPISFGTVKQNLVFFHPYSSLNSDTLRPCHQQAIIRYHQHIQTLPKEKTIPILYLPRGTKENFAGHDRRYVIQDQCKELVIQLGGKVLETDSNTDYFQQVMLVRSAKVILCDYGSNLWVNGFFAEDSHIVYLNVGWRQEVQFPGFGFLFYLISNQNKSMNNIMPIGIDDSVNPSLVYHSFAQVEQMIRTALHTT